MSASTHGMLCLSEVQLLWMKKKSNIVSSVSVVSEHRQRSRILSSARDVCRCPHPSSSPTLSGASTIGRATECAHGSHDEAQQSSKTSCPWLTQQEERCRSVGSRGTPGTRSTDNHIGDYPKGPTEAMRPPEPYPAPAPPRSLADGAVVSSPRRESPRRGQSALAVCGNMLYDRADITSTQHIPTPAKSRIYSSITTAEVENSSFRGDSRSCSSNSSNSLPLEDGKTTATTAGNSISRPRRSSDTDYHDAVPASFHEKRVRRAEQRADKAEAARRAAEEAATAAENETRSACAETQRLRFEVAEMVRWHDAVMQVRKMMKSGAGHAGSAAETCQDEVPGEVGGDGGGGDEQRGSDGEDLIDTVIERGNMSALLIWISGVEHEERCADYSSYSKKSEVCAC